MGVVNTQREFILDYLRENKDFFRKRFGVVRIGLFGSCARGDESCNSDIDVVIEMEHDKKNIHNFLQFKRHLEQNLNRTVDVGLLSAIKPAVRKQILNEIIYV